MATLDWYGCATFRLRWRSWSSSSTRTSTGSRTAPRDRPDRRRRRRVPTGSSSVTRTSTTSGVRSGSWRNTGATVVGLVTRRCASWSSRASRSSQLICVAGGERVRLSDDVTASVYPSLHSCVWSHTGMHQSGDVCLGDLGLTQQERQARFGELGHALRRRSARPRIDHLCGERPRSPRRRRRARVLARHARGHGPLPGHVGALERDPERRWRTIRPDVAILAAAGRGNVDGEPIQGSLAGVRRPPGLARRSRGKVVLSHHDDWLPGFSVATRHRADPRRRSNARGQPSHRTRLRRRDEDLARAGFAEFRARHRSRHRQRSGRTARSTSLG